MKNWIRVIFALNPKLDALTYSIDGQVDSLSSLTSVPTMELFDNIIRLNDKKVKIINLRVLHDKMKEAISEREHYIILHSARGASFGEIADKLSLDKGYVYRVYRKAVQKLTKLLISYGYDKQKFIDDYSDITLINRTYKKLTKDDVA